MKYPGMNLRFRNNSVFTKVHLGKMLFQNEKIEAIRRRLVFREDGIDINLIGDPNLGNKPFCSRPVTGTTEGLSRPSPV